MLRKIVIQICWFLIFVITLVLAVAVGMVVAIVVVPLVIVAIAAHRVIRSASKRAISTSQAARSSPTAAFAGLMSTGTDSRVLVKNIPCEHAIRGKGVLQGFADGTLQFVTSEFGSAFYFPFVGVRPEQISVWSLIRLRFKFLFDSSLRNELIRKGGSLLLPWHNLRHAIVGDRSDERSVILAHMPPGEGLQCEEFFLAKIDTPKAMLPPGDSAAIVRELGLPEPAAEMRRSMLHWRNRFNRHLALTYFWFHQIGLGLFWLLLIAILLPKHFISGTESWVPMFLVSIFALQQLSLGVYLLRQWLISSGRAEG
jgi:hypothetical protein